MDLSNDLTDQYNWESAISAGTYWKPSGKPVNKNSDIVCAMLDCTLLKNKLQKYYNIYINIEAWKTTIAAQKIDNNKLWSKNPIPPTINVQIKDSVTDDILYSCWYDFNGFHTIERPVFSMIKNKLNSCKPLP